MQEGFSFAKRAGVAVRRRGMSAAMKVPVGLVPWLLVGVGVAALLPGTGTFPLIDRDEPRFAQATREMMEGEHANWIVPYFNGQYRFDKPILIYWMMRGSYALSGVNEFGARLPSVVCSVFLALFLWQTGRRWFSGKTGLWAGAGILTCVQMLIHGRSAVADMPMVLSVALAQVAIFELLGAATPAPRWFLVLYVALGTGFLAKGPVALVVPALTLLFYRLVFLRRPLPWRNLRLAWGIPLTLGIIGAWGIPALLATQGEFLRVGIGEHVIERGHRTFQGHGGFVFYYLATAFLSLCPWVAFAGEAAVAIRRRWNDRTAFLVSWVVATYLLFSLYVTKLPHYVLPAFPAIFLLFGVLAEAESVPRWARVFSRVVCGAFIVLGLVVTPVLGLVLVMFAVRREHLVIGAAGLVLVAIGTVVGAAKLRDLNATLRALRSFGDLPAEIRCAGFKFGEPSLVFYSNRRWEFFADSASVSAWMTNSGPRFLVCAEREWRLGGPRHNWRRVSDYAAELAVLPTNGYQQAAVEGLNIARGAWVRLRLFWRLQ